jgi:hypothetical protein
MDTMIIQGVRCFRSRQEVPLAPLTLLVGENSTGKSTFLAAVRLAWDVLYTESEPDFNEEPFSLGAFDNIANYTPGKGGGRAKSFILGGKFTNGSAEPRMQSSALFDATFEEEEGQPALRRLMVESGQYSITVSKAARAKGIKFLCKAVGTKWSFAYPYFRPASLSFFLRAGGYLLHDLDGKRIPRLPSYKKDRKALEHLATGVLRQPGPRPYATAPIRTKPERTYNPKRVRLKAEGGHIPLVLARTLTGAPERRNALITALSAFGHDCGLFEEVRVRRLGRKASDAFEIEVRISGPAFNLVDVGYGVSQALPLLVDSLMGEKGQMFLMQQPEVHLHPRAQAQLGTFLAQLIKQDRKSFVIETHSDYLIDRVRTDVRDGIGLRHDQVVILYFQRHGTEVRIHPLYLDEHGNILAAPAGYRDFFLDEERRFLGA